MDDSSFGNDLSGLENEVKEFKMIKAGSVMNISLPAGMLTHLQKLLFFLASQKDEEQIKKFHEEASKFKEGSKFSEDWMNFLIAITHIIKECEKKAEKDGNVIKKEAKDGGYSLFNLEEN